MSAGSANGTASKTIPAPLTFIESYALREPLSVLIWDEGRWFMPKSVAQLTGMIVAGIVAFGTDMDLTYAMPLGVAAGMLATFFVAMSEGGKRQAN